MGHRSIRMAIHLIIAIAVVALAGCGHADGARDASGGRILAAETGCVAGVRGWEIRIRSASPEGMTPAADASHAPPERGNACPCDQRIGMAADTPMHVGAWHGRTVPLP